MKIDSINNATTLTEIGWSYDENKLIYFKELLFFNLYSIGFCDYCFIFVSSDMLNKRIKRYIYTE